MDDAIAYLRGADPVLARLLDEHGPPDLTRDASRPAPGDHYAALVRSIVGQQLSVVAARSIYRRLLEYFGGHPPSPEEVLAADPDEMRVAARGGRPRGSASLAGAPVKTGGLAS